MARVFSGVQPTGNLHLGNYLGAIRNFARLQDQNDCLYCVVDMHAITIWQSPEELKTNTREVTAAFLASGINPNTQIIFNQSSVPQHAEIAWIFNCVARIGWLNRMTQFKEKAGKQRENASVGLYVYPNLMAADILLYKASHVPVGEDQKQHLELSRDVAKKFNNDFGVDFFPIVEPIILDSAARVMSLRDGNSKMSKSDPSDYARLNLNDDADIIAKKIRKARTDSEPVPDGTVKGGSRETRPEAYNLLEIYGALAEKSLLQVQEEYGGRQFSEFKDSLVELAVEKLGPIGREMQRFAEDPGYIDEVLREGGERATSIAGPIRDEIYEIVGFIKA